MKKFLNKIKKFKKFEHFKQLRKMSLKNIDAIMLTSPLCLDDVIRCLAGIKCSEMEAYFYVFAGAKTVEELAKKIDRNRSTAQRILMNLLAQGFVKRQTITKKGPGYVYEYTATPPEEIKEMLKESLEQLHFRLKNFIEKEWDEHVKKVEKELSEE